MKVKNSPNQYQRMEIEWKQKLDTIVTTGYKMEISRIRDSRCCATPGALLTPFSRSDADAQKILYQVNNFNLNEKYISLEQLNHPTESIIVKKKKHFYF